MKSKKTMVAAMFMLTATAAFAQQHIYQAFEALRQSKQVNELSTNSTLERDPDTGRMEGMSDVYEFEIAKPSRQDRQLIADIRQAFENDEQACYSISTGSGGNAENYTSLAVGDSKKGGIAIGLIDGSKWIYACFLDPEDSLRQHRYAYALEWAEKDGKIRGQIVKTYATTQKFRQSRNSQISSFVINGKSLKLDSFGDDKSSETWITEFNTYKNYFLKNPDSTTSTSANYYATQIYKLCKDTGDLDDAEKKMLAAEIERLRNKTNDEFIQQLFDMSIERLKK